MDRQEYPYFSSEEDMYNERIRGEIERGLTRAIPFAAVAYRINQGEWKSFSS